MTAPTDLFADGDQLRGLCAGLRADVINLARLIVHLREELLIAKRQPPWASHRLPMPQRDLFDDINFTLGRLKNGTAAVRDVADRLATDLAPPF